MATQRISSKCFDLLNQAMALRHFTLKTKKTYVYAMKRYITYTGKDPLMSTLDDILKYQQEIIEKNIVSYSTYRINCCALRFFYDVAYPQKWSVAKIPYPKKETRLPVVLSQDEVLKIVVGTENYVVRAMIQLMYATGMRIGEALNFKVGQIDNQRMRIRILAGKGRVDREIKLSQTVLLLLRDIYKKRKARDTDLMFPSGRVLKPLDETYFHKHLKATVKKTGIKKRVTAHVFRHSFATHHLEDGMNIRQLQKLMGHRSVNTTFKYVNVIEERWNDTPCLLEKLRHRILEITKKSVNDSLNNGGQK